MTEPRRTPAKLPAWPVAAGTAGAFLAALAFLAGEVREGRDPALGPAEPVAAVAPQPRVVIVRRVIRRTVIHHPPRPAAVAPGAPAGAATVSPAAPSGGGSVANGAAAPAAAPAPAAAAPAPAAAAPAPAPAPLTTRSS